MRFRNTMRSVRDIPVLENIPVLVRAALNAEMENGVVSNTFRLRRALPTIEYLRKKHAKVILIGHFGDNGTETLEPVAHALAALVPGLVFCPVSTGATARAMVRDLPPGGVLMLENLRRHAGEKTNDPMFAKELAELADLFVQDSFDVLHRPHASVIGVPRLLPSYAGLLVEEEVKELQQALRPKSPSLAIMGGAKFSTKEPAIRKLLSIYDHVFVGGALGNDFIRALGHSVGSSLVSNVESSVLKELIANRRLVLPLDAVVAERGAPLATARISNLCDIASDEAILDNGPRTVEHLGQLINKAKTVLWNGPLGNYEEGYTKGTEALAAHIAGSRAYSIIGGGDTVAAVEEFGAMHYSFISTGGGAMLEFIANGTLPGLTALAK